MAPGSLIVPMLIAAATYEATLLGGSEVLPEHVWMALLRQSDATMSRALAGMQVSRAGLLQEIEALIRHPVRGQEREVASLEELPLSVETARLISRAETGASLAGDAGPSVSDVLLAFLEGATGRVEEVVRRRGLTVGGYRAEITGGGSLAR